MKKKLIPLFLLSIAVSFFFSCSNDPASSSIAEGKLSFNVAAASENGIFQPLNYIPSDVANKMDTAELSVWKKLSSCFYIDYNIINTSYYKKNKMSFLRDMEKLYDEAKAMRKSPQKLIVAFPNLASDTKVSLFELNDSTAGPDSGSDSGSDSTYVDNTPINSSTPICERILYRL